MVAPAGSESIAFKQSLGGVNLSSGMEKAYFSHGKRGDSPPKVKVFLGRRQAAAKRLAGS